LIRFLVYILITLISWDSSVSKVIGCRLDDQGSFPGWVGIFNFPAMQTGSRAYPASCSVGTRGPFLRG